MKQDLTKKIGVGIIGAGLIGGKRAAAIQAVGRGRLIAVADTDIARARALAARHGGKLCADWRTLLKDNDIRAVIVAVPYDLTVPITVAALRAGKHVLCEKPLGRTAAEARRVLAAQKRYRRAVKVGFNHRFYEGVLKAKDIFDRGLIGRPLFIRARYGYGGRYGMEKEWRMNKRISGGSGELLDQGVHIVDLARWFGGEPDRVYAVAQTKFWKTPVDDNTFVIMANTRVTTEFHVSITNWKNIFSFEIFGDQGYLQIEGKGGSYGEETLAFGRRPEKFGAPQVKIFKFQGDKSWENEWNNFLNAIAGRGHILGDTADGVRANAIVEAAYRSSRFHKEVRLR